LRLRWEVNIETDLLRVGCVVIRWSVTCLKRIESFCVTIAENMGYNEINSFVTLLNNMSERLEKGKKKEMTRCKFCSSVKVQVGRESVVGIATRYEMDRSGIEPQWGRNFSHPFILAPGSTQNPVQRVHYLFPGRKAAGAWR